jgi:putative ABC transport system permease protein
VGANQDLANRLRAVSGVEAVSTMRFAMAADGGQSISMLGIDPQVFPQVVAFSMYYVLFGVLALPSLIALLNTLAIGVIERTREIGMLLAIGATRPQVRRMVIAEALLLAAIGTALGLLAGLYLSYVMVLGMSGIFPMAYSFPLGGLVAAVAIGLIFGVIAALIPARQAAGMEIVRALQYE